jgi:hypothetical protein
MTAAARRWTPSEILLFEKRRAEKVDLNTIAAELGRSLGSVTMRGQISNVRKCQRRLRELDAGRVAAKPNTSCRRPTSCVSVRSD